MTYRHCPISAATRECRFCGYTNRIDLPPGRKVSGCTLNLAAVVMWPGKGWQTVLDRMGLRHWDLKYYHMELVDREEPVVFWSVIVTGASRNGVIPMFSD